MTCGALFQTIRSFCKETELEVTAEMEEELRTMCNLSEGIYERGAENKLIEVIMNLWNAGKDISKSTIAAGQIRGATTNYTAKEKCRL